MITFLSILIAGVSTGAIYALISLGFTLAFNSSGMLNLLQGGFVVLGGLLTLYMLWGLTAYPLQVSVERNSIVYVNQATNMTWVAVLYIIATCGSLFFSKVRVMVAFGLANLVILLVVIAVKRYAGTSVWCAYAAVASVIILVYFWKSMGIRPFKYVEAV